ncbi:MAG TPA: O-antigen ligase family protein [Casimicrobiaceae bacterium]|nr:O-antigen ligase family protein [Casimicrobiaceae bacterium]
MTAAASRAPLRTLPGALLGAMLFLLSADLLFVPVAGHKIKFGYFLVLAAWLTAPREMLDAAREGLRRLPRYVFLPLLPLAVSVATSADVKDSLAWTLWLGFDAFTAATVYAFLKAHRFSGNEVRTCIAASLGLIAFFCVIQFVAIYGFGKVVFQPQSHFDVYRINGLAGWPHFLNIFSFLLLPIVLVQRAPSLAVRALLAVLVFMLVQSTAKTGWVLFFVMGLLLLVLDRRVFLRSYFAFLLPVTVVAMLIPTPSFRHDTPAMSGTQKIEKFSADLNVADRTTSGADRVLISEMGLQVFLRHPWFGVGPRAYDAYVYSRFDQELPGVNKIGVDRAVIAKNENIWVEFLAETGVLFTLGFAFVIVRALTVPRWKFDNRLELGAWIALAMYFAVSGQFSQTGLLTLVYAVFGVYFYSRELSASAGAPSPTATVLPAFGG